MFPEIIGENYHCLAPGLRSNFNKLIERRSNKKILILVVLLIAGYFLWQKVFHDNTDKIIETSYEKPYVVVYGRDSCGWTLKYLSDLRNEGIEVIYKIVDNEEVSDELHPRMEKARLDTTSYYLPVIDVNGKMFIRPELNKVLEAYKDYK